MKSHKAVRAGKPPKWYKKTTFDELAKYLKNWIKDPENCLTLREIVEGVVLSNDLLRNIEELLSKNLEEKTKMNEELVEGIKFVTEFVMGVALDCNNWIGVLKSFPNAIRFNYEIALHNALKLGKNLRSWLKAEEGVTELRCMELYQVFTDMAFETA